MNLQLSSFVVQNADTHSENIAKASNMLIKVEYGVMLPSFA